MGVWVGGWMGGWVGGWVGMWGHVHPLPHPLPHPHFPQVTHCTHVTPPHTYHTHALTSL